MSEKTSKSVGGGIGFTGLLAVAFIVLKLCHVIDWAWWWVLAPLWMPMALALGILSFMFSVSLIIVCLKPKKGNS